MAGWNIPISIGNTSSKGSFSIAILVYQRVNKSLFARWCFAMESLFSFPEFRKRTWRNDVSSMATRAVFPCLFVVGLLEKGKLFGADVD